MCIILFLNSPAFAEEKVYRHSEEGTAKSLDPVTASTTYANTIVTSIMSTLYEYKYLKRPYELKTSIARFMPQVSSDGLTYTIEIRPGFRFANDPCFSGGKGREVVASDFVYSLKTL